MRYFFEINLKKSKTRTGLGLTPKASFLFLVVLLFACDNNSSQDAMYLHGSTMGTTYNVTVIAPPPGVAQSQLQQSIDQSLKSINQQMSTYIADSDIMRFNQSSINQTQKISPEFFDVLRLSQEVAQKTDGYFDITIGPLVELWGFGKNPKQQVPSAEAIAEAKTRVGWQYLILNEERQTIEKQRPLWLDVSAVAKGFAVDKLSELLDDKGISHYLVEIGGEMRVKGRNRQQDLWRIGIETPSLLNKQAKQLVTLTNKAIATSGDYRNFFEENGQRFSHTINPETGRPVKHNIASVSVIADTAAEADALATALNVLGEKAALALSSELQLAVYFIFYENADGRNEAEGRSQVENNEKASYRTFYTDAFKQYIQ